MAPNSFAKRLIKARKEYNLTQSELAEKCGISRQSVYQYEHGAYFPKYDVVKKLANALDVDIRYLYYGEEKPEDYLLTYKDLLFHYLGLQESYIFNDKIVDNNGVKRLSIITENQDFIEYYLQLKNLLSIKGALNKETANKVIKELMDSYDISVLKKDQDEKK